MSEGLIVSNNGADIHSNNPSDIAVDTRTDGGMKVLFTKTYTYADYSDTYLAPGPFPGTFYTLGHIIIPHGLGFPPAFKGYLNSANLSQPLPTALGEGVVTGSSDSVNVYIDKAPTDASAGGPYTVTVTVFAENLESDAL